VGGTPVAVALRDTGEFWPDRENVSWEYSAYSKFELERALRSGAVLVVGGDYESLPFHYRRWTNNDNFDHAIALKFLTPVNTTKMYDPLGGGPTNQPYDGEWIDFDAIFNPSGFCWRGVDEKYMCGIVQNTEEGETSMDTMYLDQDTPATRMMRVKDKTKVYDKPTVTSDMVKTFWNADTWRWLAGTAPGWKMTLYKNVSDTEWQAGYVQAEEVLEVKDAPVEIDPDVARIKELETTLTSLAVTLGQESDLLDEAEEKLDRIASIVGEL
jgi:hypothetical protein